MQRGRKSPEELMTEVVALVPGEKPAPPPELTERQAEDWRIAVESLPSDWLRPEIFPLICQLCRHQAMLRMVAEKMAVVEEMVHKSEVPTLDTVKVLDGLSAIHDREGRALQKVMTTLRMTPHSRYDAHKAHVKVRGEVSQKPWEIGG